MTPSGVGERRPSAGKRACAIVHYVLRRTRARSTRLEWLAKNCGAIYRRSIADATATTPPVYLLILPESTTSHYSMYSELPLGRRSCPHRLVLAASSSAPPASVGLACRPVGAWRRHLVKQSHHTTDRRHVRGPPTAAFQHSLNRWRGCTHLRTLDRPAQRFCLAVQQMVGPCRPRAVVMMSFLIIGPAPSAQGKTSLRRSPSAQRPHPWDWSARRPCRHPPAPAGGCNPVGLVNRGRETRCSA
ncbi:MAG: hypothetical protein QOD88_254 [Mycobacterium sp.]|nr:hypothetical protein [Mycobacterium sp.]